MIDLTPLDVRKKRGDFAKALRGYEAQEVDVFLELVAERMEVLVKENLQLKERSDRLGDQVKGQEGREQAVQEALVTAQELRQQVKEQANREAQLLEREARGRIEKMLQEAEKLLADRKSALEELERHRTRFLKAFRTLLERELDAVEVEANRMPLEDVTLDLELGRGSWTTDDADEEAEDAGNDGNDSGSMEAVTADEVSASEPEEASASDEVDDPPDPESVDLPEPEASVEDGIGAEEPDSADEDIPEGMSPDNALWLSTILKRDQQESD